MNVKYVNPMNSNGGYYIDVMGGGVNESILANRSLTCYNCLHDDKGLHRCQADQNYCKTLGKDCEDYQTYCRCRECPTPSYPDHND